MVSDDHTRARTPLLPSSLSHPGATIRTMPIYRLRATRGHGWIENVDPRGPSVTAIASDAKTWDDLDGARRALARVAVPGKVAFEIVASER